MKKNIVIIILLTFSNLIYSQSFEITYDVNYTLNAANPKSNKADRMILHVENSTSKFYSIFRQNIDNLIKKMEKQGASLSDFQKEKAKIPDSSIFFRIYKNFQQKGILTFTNSILGSNYKYEEKMEKPIWRIEKETKEVMGYKCQKATTNFRGRDWTAWYASDISVQDGPWKLWGLPGLILEAHDSPNLYHFTAIGLKNIEPKPIVLYGLKYISCTKAEYIKQITETYGNPTAKMGQIGVTFTATKDGKEIKNPSPITRDYIDIELDIK